MQQRHCLILRGQSEWMTEQAVQLCSQLKQQDFLWLSDHALRPAFAKPINQAQQQLGREYSLLVFDAHQKFAADAFAAILGTLRAGGTFVLLLGEQTKSRWEQRFLKQAQAAAEQIQIINQALAYSYSKPDQAPETTSVQATAEQQMAIQAVMRVLSGHRRRPLVISSDRGRGKSALLGMAAAELLRQGKQQIVVTAPCLANIDSLMTHAHLSLSESLHSRGMVQWQQGQIRFVAPDALLEQTPQADLLIVDEAAAIPAQMLEKMLSCYSRIVFSTTVHGYEGTGRGFALRFEKHLDEHAPGWHKIMLETPIRWARDDVLEAFSFDALLLNAQAAEDDSVAEATIEKCDFELVDRDRLVNDEAFLRQLFGLMTLAHYRTRPSDLQMLLDSEDMTIAVLRYNGHVVASIWLVAEHPIDNAIAEAVFNGERRLKGQLLPQSLLVHAGLRDAARLSYQRIIRIAVHPALQGHGLGSAMLQKLQLVLSDCDVIGTSFAMEQKLVHFWHKNGFSAVRFGHHADQVSGSQSMIMLNPCSAVGRELTTQAKLKLATDWTFLLARSLKSLAVELVSELSKYIRHESSEQNEALRYEARSFALHQRPFESVEIALWRWFQPIVGSSEFNQLSKLQQALLVRVILQQWTLTATAAECGLKGRAEVITELRLAVAALLQTNIK